MENAVRCALLVIHLWVSSLIICDVIGASLYLLLQAPGILDDRRQICCKSGNIDGCGVCNGAADKCGTDISFVLDGTSFQRRKLLQASTSTNLTDMFAAALGYDASEIVLQMNKTDPTKTVVCSYKHQHLWSNQHEAEHQTQFV
jgi:hypothetical protein